MKDETESTVTGWRVGQSITMELDTVLMAVGGYFLSSSLPDEYLELVTGVPKDWQADLKEMIGEGRFGILPVLEFAAGLVGSLTEGDYGKATLAIRQTTLQQVLIELEEGAVSSATQSEEQRFTSAASKNLIQYYRMIGFELEDDSPQAKHFYRTFRNVARIFQGGDLHARFWHWLDRFYYELYLPWRRTRSDVLELRRKQAVTALGGEQVGDPPDVTWLSAQHPISRYPELSESIKAGRLPVYFWVEPFGLSDSWLLWPGLLACSFAEAGVLYENFRAQAEDVARRTQALADPTRLAILRIIRHFGMINTDIANYLGISRPTVSVHAKILREAGLIRSRQVGRTVRHEIVPQEIHRLVSDLERFLDVPSEDEP